MSLKKRTYTSIIAYFVIISLLQVVFLQCKSNRTSVAKKSTHSELYDTDELTNKAKKHIGTRYKLGGSDPKTGFDCSGFTKYVFGKFDINLPATAALQSAYGRSVVISEAKKGDLIFFKGGDAKSKVVGHVGIVVSDRGQIIKFIHASSSKGIMISGLDEKYFRERFVSVRRVK